MKRQLFFIILLFPILLFGQNKSELGLFLGASNNGTDVHSWGKDGSSITNGLGFAYGLNYTYNFTEKFGLRLNYNGTKLTGDDVDLSDLQSHVNRKYNFSTPLHEIGALLQWNFLNKKDSVGADFKKSFSPYIVGGAALSFTNPTVDWSGNLRPDKNAQDEADVKKTNFQVPFGLGVKYNYSRKMYFGFEVRQILPLNDYIDGISVSANPDKNDTYTFFGFNIGMKLGKQDRDGDGVADEVDACPDIPGLAEYAGCPDTDGDGVIDTKDDCPMVPGVPNLSGCPDSDGDGIANKFDDCPNVPGERQFKGCPDSDKDGVRDIDDKCPQVKGLKEYEGCPPPDRDGDGVMDKDDKCPDVAGKVNGCPDTDGDGVIDMEDKCPDVAGDVNGCPDRDKDGIVDNMDKCPDTPGIKANKGCPEVKQEVKAKIMSIAKSIYFKTGSDILSYKSKKKLNELIPILNEYPEMGFSIEGHTDSVGDDAKNMTLSQKRADAVKKYLVDKGVDPSRLIATGYGETMPVADNNTKSGRQQNRRVELKSIF